MKISDLPSKTSAIKILIVEPNSALLHGLSADLSQIGYQVAGTQDKQLATKEFILLKPDLVILDVNIPIEPHHARKEGLGLALAKEFTNQVPNTGIVFYTSEEKYVADAEKIYKSGTGGVGYISKETTIPLSSILPNILAGYWVSIITKRDLFSNLTIDSLLFGLADNTKNIVLIAASCINNLSDKEKETLSLLGKNNYSIARQLGLKKKKKQH
jgi:DNA-binding NarL/FixJ family response regulator